MKHFLKVVVLGLFSTTVLGSGSHSHSHDDVMYSVGKPGQDTPNRVIEVSMQDSMRFVFSPDMNLLKDSEIIEFRVRNDGQLQHEFSIGNSDDQVRHAIMMQKNARYETQRSQYDFSGAGESAEISWKFMGKDTVVFACNVPGHFEAGMKHILAINPG